MLLSANNAKQSRHNAIRGLVLLQVLLVLQTRPQLIQAQVPPVGQPVVPPQPILGEPQPAAQPNVCPTMLDYLNMQNNTNCWYNFAADDTCPQIITKSGYALMEYKVQTMDGYILTLFRIPPTTGNKGPVFMLHGVHCTSGMFVSNGRDSMAFQLADAGYDVWLGNYRGTFYSEAHSQLNSNQRQFWNYGADEIALIDVPTMLNTVTYYSNNRKVIYIGHSLGTTAAMMYASEFPDHAKRSVKLFILISPAYKMTNMRSPYRLAFPLLPTFLRLATNLNIVHAFSWGNMRRSCLQNPALMMLCLNLLNMFTGPLTQIAPDNLPVLFNQFPGGTSLRTLMFIADSQRGNFRKYDFGRRNIAVYGTSKPPAYNISKIPVPVYIFYATGDWCTTAEDSIKLYSKLPPKIRFGMYKVPQINFNHMDFFFGRNAKTLVNEQLFHVLRSLPKDEEDVIFKNLDIYDNNF